MIPLETPNASDVSTQGDRNDCNRGHRNHMPTYPHTEGKLHTIQSPFRLTSTGLMWLLVTRGFFVQSQPSRPHSLAESSSTLLNCCIYFSESIKQAFVCANQPHVLLTQLLHDDQQMHHLALLFQIFFLRNLNNAEYSAVFYPPCNSYMDKPWFCTGNIHLLSHFFLSIW